ncbi:MAG: alpha-L-fucosidase [Acidobacteriota bacterium]
MIDRWDPNALMDLYVDMGARYFMAMGVHHDNFDCWDSAFRPWNSVRVGPKTDIVGTWKKVARRHGLRYGKGQWWEGMDPVDLSGPPHTLTRGPRSLPGNDPLLSPFVNQFMWRVDDAVTQYHPDVIYFDEHAGDSHEDLGVHMGLGFLGPQVAANYDNSSRQWNHAIEPHSARSGRSRSGGDSTGQRRGRLVEGQRRSGLWLASV